MFYQNYDVLILYWCPFIYIRVRINIGLSVDHILLTNEFMSFHKYEYIKEIIKRKT